MIRKNIFYPDHNIFRLCLRKDVFITKFLLRLLTYFFQMLKKGCVSLSSHFRSDLPLATLAKGVLSNPCFLKHMIYN